MSQPTKCGCWIANNSVNNPDSGQHIVYCPLHEAAGELQEAVKYALGFIPTCLDSQKTVAILQTALAASEGKV